MSFLTRYRDDQSRPTLRDAGRDVLVRAVLPILGLLALGLVAGWIVMQPLGGWKSESSFNAWLQTGRTPLLDEVAMVASTMGAVIGNLVLCLVLVIGLWLVTRQWWVSIVPAIALSLEAIVHAVTSAVINRERPEVEQIDAAQPTASFPSGHMGATTAQLLVLVLASCAGIENRVLRTVVIVAATGFLGLLAWSRLYLGMHHLSDVIVGAVNGVACGLLAWGYLRRT